MIEYIDPNTGRYFKVAERPETVRAAERLGYMPASAEDDDKAFEVLFPAESPEPL